MVGESTRRLPNWMMVGSSTSIVVNDEDKKKNNNIKKKEKKTEVNKYTVDCGGNSSATTLPSFNSFSLKERKTSKDDECGGGGGVLNKRKVRKIGKPQDVVLAPINHQEESCDLTVEDLVTIAEECVIRNSGESCLNRNFSVTTSNDLQDEKQTQITPLNLTSEESLPKVTDQDMLHLFLGPLLTKPLNHNKTSGFPTDDMGLFSESSSQPHSDAPPQMVPISKKKTSLKNKVSLLLD